MPCSGLLLLLIVMLLLIILLLLQLMLLVLVHLLLLLALHTVVVLLGIKHHREGGHTPRSYSDTTATAAADTASGAVVTPMPIRHIAAATSGVHVRHAEALREALRGVCLHLRGLLQRLLLLSRLRWSLPAYYTLARLLTH